MAKYTVYGSCFDHAGTLEEEAKNKKDAEVKFVAMKKNILNKLKVNKEGCALVYLFSGNKELKKERVEYS